MSIRERLERGPLERERNVVDFGRHSTENPYKKIALDVGKQVLEAAGVPSILQDFADTIRSDHPDVIITEPEIDASFSTHIQVRWNFREEDQHGRKEPMCEFLHVTARPLRESLRIGSREEEEMEKSQWSGHPEIIEDAVVLAYQNPIIYWLRPVRI